MAMIKIDLNQDKRDIICVTEPEKIEKNEFGT